MDNVELSKKLREISRNGSTFRRMICKMAAQRIDKLSEELERTKDLLAAAVADLRKADVDCAFCAHKKEIADCVGDEEEYPFCENCPHDCHCKDCVDNSKWVYHGLPAGNDNPSVGCADSSLSIREPRGAVSSASSE